MMYQCHVPASFVGSLEKIAQMLDGQLANVNPFLVTEFRWTRGGLQLFVKPWTERPYVYCVVVKPLIQLSRDEYTAFFKHGRTLHVQFQATTNGFNATIRLAPTNGFNATIRLAPTTEEW